MHVVRPSVLLPRGATVIAALVGQTPITVDAVRHCVEQLRTGPRGPVLPADDTAEGRQLARWALQLLIAEQVMSQEAAERGLAPADDPVQLDQPARLELGSVLAAVLATNRLAQAVFWAVTADVNVDDKEVADYFHANRDKYQGRLTRPVTHRYAGRPVNAGRRYLVRAGDFAPSVDAAVFAAPDGATVGPIDGHAFIVGPLRPGDVPFDRAAPGIRAELLAAHRRHDFTLWADARCAAAQLMPGFEHPADIRQPDHTHRH
jgi:[acyl-carrier-protein] S-malonyltransferase